MSARVASFRSRRLYVCDKLDVRSLTYAAMDLRRVHDRVPAMEGSVGDSTASYPRCVRRRRQPDGCRVVSLGSLRGVYRVALLPLMNTIRIQQPMYMEVSSGLKGIRGAGPLGDNAARLQESLALDRFDGTWRVRT